MWDDARELALATRALAAAAILLLAWSGIAWLARQPAFAVRSVIVGGDLARVDPARLEAAIRSDLSGNFLTSDLATAQAALAKLPWVRSVSIRRQWPRTLEIGIEEHRPLARWNDRALVNTAGEVFAADYADPLPRFFGADGEEATVTRRFHDAARALAPLSLAPTEIGVSARGSWHLKARGAPGPIEIELGRDDPVGRLARFAAGYSRTIAAAARAGLRIEHVDARYANGFAARLPATRERAAAKPSKSG